MNNVVITLLVLGTSRTRYFLELHGALGGQARQCRLCTHPSQLPHGHAREHRDAYLIDGTDAPDIDIRIVTAILRSAQSAFVAVLAPERPAWLDAAADGQAQLLIPDHLTPAHAASIFLAEVRRWRAGTDARPAQIPASPVPPSYGDLVSPSYWKLGVTPAHTPDRAHWRPASPVAMPQTPPTGQVWRLTNQGRTLLCPDGRMLTLSRMESQLLLWFSRSPDGLLLHDAADADKPAHPFKDSRSMAVVISRLRAKCRNANINLPIVSRHAAGYQFKERLVAL